MGARRLPATLRAAVGLLVIEALGVAVLAVVEVGLLATRDAAEPLAGALLAGMLAAVAAVLARLAALLAARRVAGRNPAVALHLLALPLGWYAAQGERPALGLALLALCALGLALLLAPPTTAALGLR